MISGIVREFKRAVNQTDLDTLILFVTNACNLSCGFCCYADNLNQTRDISFDNLIKTSQTMPKFRCLLLSGGEPFIRPKLDEIMLAFARNNGISSIAIPTNGWYTDRMEQMCKSFLEQNHDVMLTISFSVDGLEATHNAIRGKPETFSKLCETLELLSPWRETYPNLRLRAHSVVTPDNIGGTAATVDYFFNKYDLDEHSLEIVRDNHMLGAHHDSPEKQAMAKQYMELIRYTYDLYYKNNRSRRGKLGYLPDGLTNLLTYAHVMASNQVKYDRIMGKLWSFPCTAGRKILVIDGSGSLRACEHRDEVIDLRKFDFDMEKALATGLMQQEVEKIKKDRCDCIHGCFVGSSLQHSPKAIVTNVLPQAPGYFGGHDRRPDNGAPHPVPEPSAVLKN